MVSKAGTFVVMYAPSDDYSTENATVKVTARSVDGEVPASGFGLLVHCAQSKAKQLEDYGLLIYPADEPEYEIVKHKNGTQSSGGDENKIERDPFRQHSESSRGKNSRH